MKLAIRGTKNLIQKTNRIIWTLIINGVLLLILALLVVWSPLILRLLVGLTIIIVAYLFFYLAYRIWELRQHLEKYLKMK